jgi:hypothetical protein
MFKNIRFKNMKSVTFKVRSFEVPPRQNRMLKHTIYAAKNTGFAVKRGSLENGYGIARLGITTSGGFNTVQQAVLGKIGNSRIERVFCFPTHQNSRVVNCMLAVTQEGLYCIPFFFSLPIDFIATPGIPSFDCFAYSYSRDRDFIFAGNSNGIYVADNSLIFTQLSASIRNAKQMIVFDKRLFVLDADGRTIHFTESLDLLKFEGSIRMDETLGKILSLDVYENKLLIVCENGFNVMDCSFDSSKFRLSTLCRSYEDIIDGSAKVLGDTIFFLTKGGMCQSVRGVISLLDVDVQSAQELCSTVFDNKYFLSNGEKMIVIEKFVDSVTIYEGLGVRSFERIADGLNHRLAVLTEDNGFVFQIENGIGTNPCVWESQDFALTYASGNQYVRQVLVKTATDIEVVVIGDRAEQSISVKGSPDIQKLNLNLKGEVFRIRLVGNHKDINISSLSVVVGF